MKRPVTWSNAARDDYWGIIRYIAQDNSDAAERVANRVDKSAAALGDFATGKAGRVTGTYEKVLHDLPYILVYEIIVRPDGGEAVAILHVIHGARDWPESKGK